MHLIASALLRVFVLAFNGYAFSANVWFFRFLYVLCDYRVPYFGVRAAQDVYTDFGGDRWVFFDCLLDDVDACTAAYFSVFWCFVYFRSR